MGKGLLRRAGQGREKLRVRDEQTLGLMQRDAETLFIDLVEDLGFIEALD